MPSKNSFPYSRVLVFGAARSGVGAMHLLRHHGIDVVLVDERPAMEFRSLIRRLRRLYVTPYFGPIKEDVLRGCKAMIISPGIPLTHKLVREAQERNIPIISEVELASFWLSADAAQRLLMTALGTRGLLAALAGSHLEGILATDGTRLLLEVRRASK